MQNRITAQPQSINKLVEASPSLKGAIVIMGPCPVGGSSQSINFGRVLEELRTEGPALVTVTSQGRHDSRRKRYDVSVTGFRRPPTLNLTLIVQVYVNLN